MNRSRLRLLLGRLADAGRLLRHGRLSTYLISSSSVTIAVRLVPVGVGLAPEGVGDHAGEQAVLADVQDGGWMPLP